jgi:hypothetical protein
MSDITAFLVGTGSDHKDRTLKEILELDDQWWDDCHDFIQWLFPLPVESKHAAFSPVLTHLDVEFGGKDHLIQQNMLKAVDRYCKFLGIEYRQRSHSADRIRFIRGKNFHDQTKYWLKARDHNHLRINRMIQSLVLFELEDVAREFFKCLSLIKCDFPDCITDETMVYWRNALTGYSY